MSLETLHYIFIILDGSILKESLEKIQRIYNLLTVTVHAVELYKTLTIYIITKGFNLLFFSHANVNNFHKRLKKNL